jgi:hypothetical protein
MSNNDQQLAFEHLPPDILLNFAQFMSFPDFACFIRTCSAFHDVTTYEDIWRLFYVRQLESEKRAIAHLNTRQSRSRLKKINKNLMRHTNYEHRRFIQGTEFVRVLRLHMYLNVFDCIPEKSYKLAQVDSYYTFMLYVERMCNSFMPNDTQAKKNVL